MKKATEFIFIFSIFCFSTLWNIGFAQNSYSIEQYKMTISGTSTLHDWVSDVTQLSGDAHLDISQNELNSIRSLTVSIPVKSIVSTKGRIMDGKTYDALKEEQHPNIIFKLQEAKVDNSSTRGMSVQADGYLTIAGKTRAVKILAKGELTSAGTILFKGQKTLKMTDFGIAPPTALMGSIKTGDEVIINFSVSLSTK